MFVSNQQQLSAIWNILLFEVHQIIKGYNFAPWVNILNGVVLTHDFWVDLLKLRWQIFSTIEYSYLESVAFSFAE